MNHQFQGFVGEDNSYEGSSKSYNSIYDNINIYNHGQTGSSILYLVTTGSGTGPGGTKVDYICSPSIYDQRHTNY